MATPKIDRVLQERKSKEDAETKEISAECYGSRLQVLEKQLSHLLRRSEEVCEVFLQLLLVWA